MQRFLINLLYLWNFDNKPHEKKNIKKYYTPHIVVHNSTIAQIF